MKLSSHLLGIFLCVLTINVSAQEKQEEKKPPVKSSIQINGGTQGVGADLNLGITRYFKVRLGASVIPVELKDLIDIPDLESSTIIKADFKNAHMFFDLSPVKNGGLRLVAGAAYFANAKASISAMPNDGFAYGDIQLTSQEVGSLTMDLDWKGIRPYVGLGLGRAVPKGRFNINFDIGAYYIDSPKGTVVGTGLLAGNSVNSVQLEKNFAEAKFFPVIQMNLNFKL